MERGGMGAERYERPESLEVRNMKKIIVVFAVALLFPMAALPSHSGGGGGGGGGRGGGGGSFSGGGRSGGFSGGGFGGWGGGYRGGFGWGNRGFTNSYRGNSRSYYGSSFRGNRGYGNYYGSNRNTRGYGNNYNGNRSMGSHSFNGNSLSGRFNGRSIPGNLQNSSARAPSRGPDGQRLTGSAFSPRQMNSGFVRNQMNSITGDRNFRSQVNGFNKTAEGNRNQYFWHSYGGWNYCNYCDGFGCNWYGWYCGGGFFWTQYYGGLFWWNDPWYGCWDYWGNGCWNYPDPATNTVYIYENGQYEPSNGDGGYNNQPRYDGEGPQAGGGPGTANRSGENPGSTASREATGEILFQSDDNSRTVKLVGDTRDAFLVVAGAKTLFLDTGVKGVRFTGSGKGLKVQLTLRDGSMETFTADGKPVNGTVAG
jgi:hypothetical protein